MQVISMELHKSDVKADVTNKSLTRSLGSL